MMVFLISLVVAALTGWFIVGPTEDRWGFAAATVAFFGTALVITVVAALVAAGEW